MSQAQSSRVGHKHYSVGQAGRGWCWGHYLSELLQRVLGPKDKLQQHSLAVAAGPPLGAVDVGGHTVKDVSADVLRVAQRRHDLVVQQPADLGSAAHKGDAVMRRGTPALHLGPSPLTCSQAPASPGSGLI